MMKVRNDAWHVKQVFSLVAVRNDAWYVKQACGIN